MRSWIAVGLAIAISGCAYTAPRPTPTYQRMRSFDEAEYGPYAGKGTASISGQAFLKTRGGEVKYAAGEVVFMNPVTTYSKEWWTIAIQRGLPMSQADARVDAYARETTADGEGRFKFEGLQPGDYYVACSVSWEYVAGFTAGYARRRTTGGMVGARVSVTSGEHRNVILEPVRVY